MKGISYDVGTEFRPGEISRPVWLAADVSRDMLVIRDDLHCTSVNLYGTDLARLEEAATVALGEGLHVSFQPRSIDQDRTEALRWFEQAAQAAEALRTGDNLTLNTGCEISLFTRGFLPGRSYLTRMRSLVWAWPMLSFVNARLNRHLADVARMARRHFGGAITYGAGTWESVDWTPFDLVGVILYRDRWNEKTYLTDLRKLFEHGKPVVITEFGCATFDGAERQGGAGWTIVDFGNDPPVIKPGHRRSEDVQAEHLSELLDVFKQEGVHGAYVFDFMAASFAHHPEPRQDLDMASYGIVRVVPLVAGQGSVQWVRKKAFEAVERAYEAD